MDLRSRFGHPPKQVDKNTRILVVELEEGVVGFLVDSVREVIRIEASTIEEAPQMAMSVDSAFIRGVARLEERLIILVDLASVISAPQYAYDMALAA